MEGGFTIMGWEIVNIVDSVHEQLLSLRAIKYIIEKDMFKWLWDKSTHSERADVLVYIQNLEKDKLINWINTHRMSDISDYTTRQLKDTARVLKVANWSRLSKMELIVSIKAKEDHMALSNQVMLDEIKSHLKRIIPGAIAANVDPNIYCFYPDVENLDKRLSTVFIRPAFIFVQTFCETTISRFEEVKALLPDEIWERYHKWGIENFTDCREVKMLNEVLRAIRRELKSEKRPDFFKKSLLLKEAKIGRKELSQGSEETEERCESTTGSTYTVHDDGEESGQQHESDGPSGDDIKSSD
jgi:hypothetical protein